MFLANKVCGDGWEIGGAAGQEAGLFGFAGSEVEGEAVDLWVVAAVEAVFEVATDIQVVESAHAWCTVSVGAWR